MDVVFCTECSSHAFIFALAFAFAWCVFVFANDRITHQIKISSPCNVNSTTKWQAKQINDIKNFHCAHVVPRTATYAMNVAKKGRMLLEREARTWNCKAMDEVSVFTDFICCHRHRCTFYSLVSIIKQVASSSSFSSSATIRLHFYLSLSLPFPRFLKCTHIVCM